MSPTVYAIRMANGSTLTGVVHGHGGPCNRPEWLRGVLRRYHMGRVPKPAVLSVYPAYTAASDGPCVRVDLADVIDIAVA